VGIPHIFTKVLASGAINNIAQSQSPGSAAILLNGSTTNYLSTTASANVAVGVTILPLASVAGLVPGLYINDTTHAAIASGTYIIAVGASSVVLSQPVGGVGITSGDTIVVTNPYATLDTQRRVAVTSGGNDSSIVFTLYGTNQYGNPIVDQFNGANAGTAYSNLDFLTVTNVVHTGSIATTVEIGTLNTSSAPATSQVLGSTPWFGVNWHIRPFEVSMSGQVLSGNATWGWQYTYDDPNNISVANPQGGVTYPQVFNHPTLNQQSGTLDGQINDPVAAIRLVIFYNSAGYTGTVRGTWLEAGISGQ
jgi:hypothetical protein